MTASSDGATVGVSNQLASLVPKFNPASDDLTVYRQKIELVLAAWPKGRITELVTRLILNCEGTAFQKLQLNHDKLLENDVKSVHTLVELLGGQWGKLGLERQYEEAEVALFQTAQRGDESNDSYVARADVAWTKLLSRKLTLEDLQAFCLLRGSSLSAEDKKRVILEADQSQTGKLTVQKVTESVRLLGASFFQEVIGSKRTVKNKVYDSSVCVAEGDVQGDSSVEAQMFVAEDQAEEEFIESLHQEGDEDALLTYDFENVVNEVIQEDSELAAAYVSYQEARQRLSEKFRNRGFWPTRGSSSQSYKGKSDNKGKGKGRSNSFGRPRRTLQDRIMNSNCRICNRRGHWKAECPYRDG